MSTSPTAFDMRTHLRQATQDAHRRVDRVISQFDLTQPSSYRGLLRAFGMVVPFLEETLQGRDVWTGWRPRAPLLAMDLAEMAEVMPDAIAPIQPISFTCPWAVQYVLEGSRLGGRVLAQRVGDGLPKAYLEAFIEGADWQQFQAELQAEADRREAAWLDNAVVVARFTFELFERAAESELATFKPCEPGALNTASP